jgi:chromate reductase, NAD(P)H dehydrogenase (quinone)
VTILGISGSLRHDSYNTMLLRNVPLELELWDGLKDIPPYDEDDDVEPAPPAVARMRAAVAGADAILFATPEYNASVPGQLKNAVDWLSRPRVAAALRNKPVAVIGASTGAFGAVWAQAELRKVLATAGARVVDAEVAVGHAHERFDAEGRLRDENLEQQLRDAVDTLAAELPGRVRVAA